MKEALILEHKTFISAKRAAEVFGYASDYVGQLCRAGKLECKMVGRSWFVTEESLKKHQLSVLEDAQDEVVEAPLPVPKKEETLVLEVPVVQVAAVQVQAPVVAVAPMNYKVSFVPRSFALPYVISNAYLFAPSFDKDDGSSFPFFKISLGLGTFMIAFFFMFQSLILPTNISKNHSLTNAVSASVISASQEFIGKVFSFFSAIPELARTVFKNKNAVIVKTENPQSEFNGLAVVPSSNSVEQDETMKQKIRDSFSDEVRITPDESGTAGVITPVFRKAKGDDFVYVLVPVNN